MQKLGPVGVWTPDLLLSGRGFYYWATQVHMVDLEQIRLVKIYHSQGRLKRPTVYNIFMCILSWLWKHNNYQMFILIIIRVIIKGNHPIIPISNFRYLQYVTSIILLYSSSEYLYNYPQPHIDPDEKQGFLRSFNKKHYYWIWKSLWPLIVLWYMIINRICKCNQNKWGSLSLNVKQRLNMI